MRLHTYLRNPATCRIRIALNRKRLSYETRQQVAVGGCQLTLSCGTQFRMGVGRCWPERIPGVERMAAAFAQTAIREAKGWLDKYTLRSAGSPWAH